MKETIITLVRMKKELGIPLDQCVYLLSIEQGIQSTIPDLALKLNTNKFINGNKLNDDVRSIIYNVPIKAKSLVVRGSYPIITKQTGDIVKRLAKTFLPNGLSSKDRDRVAAHSNNYIAAPFFHMFFGMFPTSGKDNKDWDKHFKTDYTGVTLRIMSKGTVKKLEKVWKNKDFGLFLIGTYLFIKGCRSTESDKYYIKSIPHYLEEVEHWYGEAEDMLERGELNSLMEEKNRVRNSTIAI